MKFFNKKEQSHLDKILDFVNKVQTEYGLGCVFHSVYGAPKQKNGVHELIIEGTTVAKERTLQEIVESINSIEDMLIKRRPYGAPLW